MKNSSRSSFPVFPDSAPRRGGCVDGPSPSALRRNRRLGEIERDVVEALRVVGRREGSMGESQNLDSRVLVKMSVHSMSCDSLMQSGGVTRRMFPCVGLHNNPATLRRTATLCAVKAPSSFKTRAFIKPLPRTSARRSDETPSRMRCLKTSPRRSEFCPMASSIKTCSAILTLSSRSAPYLNSRHGDSRGERIASVSTSVFTSS